LLANFLIHDMDEFKVCINLHIFTKG